MQLRRAEIVNLRLRRFYKYHQSEQEHRRQIGQEVEEIMNLPPDPHDSVTESYTRPTRIIRNPFDPYKTQPLGEEE